MNPELKYVGITHEQATVSQRSLFALNELEQQSLRTQLMKNFSLKGLLLFFTCNRAEIYFESDKVSGFMIKRFFMELVQSIRQTRILPADVVTVYETTNQTVKHLFLVANGLRSAIPGDPQVISQLRAAYKESLQAGHQGSLMERCIQHVFRSHKQIFNNTTYHHQNGSAPTKIINTLEEHYSTQTNKVDVLVVGAGAMTREILPMLCRNKKFNMHVANRTLDKAEKLARKYRATVVNWELVKDHKLEEFDVIITAVSHCKNLITHIEPGSTKKVLIDLAMPANIKNTVQCESIVLYNIDILYTQEDSTQISTGRNLAQVNQIIKKESTCFFDWLDRKIQRLREAA